MDNFKEKNFFEILKIYLKIKLKNLILFFTFCLIFILVAYLYNLSLSPIFYGVILSSLIGLTFLIIDFFIYSKKHKSLDLIKYNLDTELDNMISSNNLIEEDYQEVIRLLNNERKKIISEYDSIKTDSINYYTMWAHQIKTPISAMRLLLQSEEISFGKELENELFKIEEYVGFVLNYLKLEDLSSDLVLDNYSLDEIVKTSIKKYSKIFIRKRIKMNFSELNSIVLTDRKWLLFVIEQILSNALKYTPSLGEVSIYMDKNNLNTLVIEDTGIGISEEDIPRIFERGFTGYNGRLNKKSTGLGLYLCKEILNKLSHHIYVESIVDKGTKIFIDLSRKDLNFN